MGQRKATASGSGDKMRRHREKLRAKGLRPLQLWVVDTARPGFDADIRRQCRAANRSKDSASVLDLFERIHAEDGWP